ncbi:MAG: PIG-L deacetylase family protein [Chitinophagaceae bacterium]
MGQNRRKFIGNSVTSIGILGLSTGLQSMVNHRSDKKLNVVCVGGHPDDPETGCGGTLAKMAAAGHTVTVIYLTTGEAGIPNKSHTESAMIRKAEAIAACKILKAKPVFAGQIDGDTVVNNEWVEKVKQLIEAENPDLVFTHWPVDSHKDHQVASLLTIQSWTWGGKKFDLYFFEVCLGGQTRIFHPTDYIDITAMQEIKKKAVFCHDSQNPKGIYENDDCNHGMMEKFRGMEVGVAAAEGFVKCGTLNFNP